MGQNIQFCQSFVNELLTAKHDFSADSFKLALFTSTAALSVSTTAYSVTNELSASGYTAGGASAAVSSGFPQAVGTVASCRFDAVSWTLGSGSALRYGLLYNTSKSNRAVLVLDFGALSVSGTFQVSFPLTVDPLVNIRCPVSS
jgi:hypothetical protein